MLHEIIANGWIDRDFVDEGTVGFDKLREQTAECGPEWVARICGKPTR